MRYRLRTLLLIAALGPPALAAAWYFGGCGKIGVSRYSQDAVIRSKLLAHTPPGTSAVEVISFVVNSLRHEDYTHAYFKYVKAYESSIGRRELSVINTETKEIEVIVTEWPAGFMASELVVATWHFDRKDRVRDITIRRRTLGP